MSAPQKYSPEVRDRAVRLIDDLLADDQLQLSVTGAWRRVGEQLGINRDTLRIVSRPFGPLRGRLALGSIDPSAKLSAYRLASPSKSWLMARAPRVITGRNSFRYTRPMTLVLPWPTKCAISSMVIPELESKDTKLCRNSRGVNSLGSSPAALAIRRKERRTLAASSADPCRCRRPGPAQPRSRLPGGASSAVQPCDHEGPRRTGWAL